MSMSLCGASSLSFGSQCFFAAFVNYIPATLFIAASFHRYSQCSHYLPFPTLDPKTSLFLRMVQAGYVLEMLLLSLHYFIQNPTSFASLISTILQLLGWAACTVITTKEVWRITEWPGRIVKLFLLSSIIINIFALATTNKSTDNSNSSSSSMSSGTIIIFATSLFLVTLSLFVFVMFKEKLRTNDEREQLDLDRVSVDLTDGHPVLLSEDRGNLMTMPWNWFWGFGGGGGTSGAWYSSARTNEDDEGYFSHISRGSNTNPLIQGGGGGEDEEVGGGAGSWDDPFSSSPVKRQGSFTGLRSALEKHTQPTTLAATHTHIHNSGSAQQQTHSHTSAALTRALNNQRARFGAGGAGVGGAGNGSNNGSSSSSSSSSSSGGIGGINDRGARSSSGASFLAANGGNSVASGAGGDEGERDLKSSSSYHFVAVSKWALRRRRAGLGSGEAGEEVVKEEQSEGVSGEAEVEYEITIHAPASALASSKKEDVWGGSAGGGSSNSRRSSGSGGGKDVWQVWKTASEVLSLHAALVLLLGDGTRRPRLKTSSHHTTNSYAQMPSSSSSLSSSSAPLPVDIRQDMRSIAIYLQVLLRTHADAPPLRAFLEFPEAVTTTTTSTTTTGAATAATAAGAASPASTVVGEQASATSAPRERDQGGAEVVDAAVVTTSTTTNGSSNANEEQGQQQQPKPNEEETLGGGEGGEKEKFRRLWTTLRVKLKPREIGIRCRLFEGVISGAEITDWLREQNHCSVLQACAIGQKLIQLGLLVTVTNGYLFEDDEGGAGVGGNGGEGYGEEETAAASSMSFSFSSRSMQNVSALLAAATATTTATTLQQQQDDFFSNASSHLYKFGKPSSAATSSSASSSSSSSSISMRSPSFSAASSHSLFGSRISANISHWVREGGMGGSGGRDSFSSPPIGTGAEAAVGSDEGVFQVVAGDSAGSDSAYGGGSIKGGYIEYVCRISHGGDEWSVNRRFREFEALSANLSKAGVRPTGVMPSKTGLAKKITTIVGATSSGEDVETLEERRRGLEAFLTQTMIDVVEAKSEEAALVLARFLDDQHDRLAIH